MIPSLILLLTAQSQMPPPRLRAPELIAAPPEYSATCIAHPQAGADFTLVITAHGVGKGRSVIVSSASPKSFPNLALRSKQVLKSGTAVTETLDVPLPGAEPQQFYANFVWNIEDHRSVFYLVDTRRHEQPWLAKCNLNLSGQNS